MFRFDVKILVAALKTEDEIGAVLRIHLLLEKFLDWIYDNHVKDEQKRCIQWPKIFGGKLSIATALGLPVEIANSIHQLNNVRNGLAHRDESLNASKVAEYGRQVDKIASINPNFLPLSKRDLNYQYKDSGIDYFYGNGNVKLDFVIASLALLSSATVWSGRGFPRV